MTAVTITVPDSLRGNMRDFLDREAERLVVAAAQCLVNADEETANPDSYVLMFSTAQDFRHAAEALYPAWLAAFTAREICIHETADQSWMRAEWERLVKDRKRDLEPMIGGPTAYRAGDLGNDGRSSNT
jgi:hypothetical protein